MTIQLAYLQLTAQLYEIYDTREAQNIADLIIENITGLKKIDRIIHKEFLLSVQQQQALASTTDELLQHKPVQYVLHEAWFFNMQLYVDENVLIPRPETEELVEWIVKDESEKPKIKNKKVLDVGAGSGCIAIALKKTVAAFDVYAIDVSEVALNVAKRNANKKNVKVNFHQIDFLNSNEWKHLPMFDIVVSNPPYIKKSEAQTMNKNVLLHEPHLALFVPDEEALKFYKAIVAFVKTKLKKDGSIYVEINETLAHHVIELFSENGFKNLVLKKDLQGKDRMIKANY